jgi:quercetin dioxygenase-like cupin family protein
MTERDVDKSRPMATGTKQLETDRAIVWEWRMPPGSRTGWHRHGHDYIVVPLVAGKLGVWTGSQYVESDMKVGVSYSRAVGVEHDVINPNPHEYVFIEIELKP